MANPSSARAGRPISAIAIEAAPARDARRRSRRDNLLRIAISPMCQSHRNDVLPMPPGQWLAMPYALDQNQDDGGVISTSAIGTNAHEPCISSANTPFQPIAAVQRYVRSQRKSRHERDV